MLFEDVKGMAVRRNQFTTLWRHSTSWSQASGHLLCTFWQFICAPQTESGIPVPQWIQHCEQGGLLSSWSRPVTSHTERFVSICRACMFQSRRAVWNLLMLQNLPWQQKTNTEYVWKETMYSPGGHWIWKMKWMYLANSSAIERRRQCAYTCDFHPGLLTQHIIPQAKNYKSYSWVLFTKFDSRLYF